MAESSLSEASPLISRKENSGGEDQGIDTVLRAVIDNAAVWVDVLDENGNVLIWNKAAE